MAIIQAITMASDRLDIFCQAGQLNVPRSPSDLMAFLEQMVHPVNHLMPAASFIPRSGCWSSATGPRRRSGSYAPAVI